jgi:lipid-binding SYLF domain-containing protein
MRKAFSAFLAIALCALPFASMAANKETDRLENCGMVFDEILRIPDNIPQNLLDKAECVIVIPSVLKAAFLVGGNYGRGAMTCRSGEHFTGKWGAPSMIALEGGSVGFQLGGQATDFVILVMNPRGATAILSSKVKLGADASYSRARGLFAGVSLEGSTLRPDNNANESVYHKKLNAADIVRKGTVAIPPAAQKMVSLLDQHSPKNTSDPNSLK